MCLWTDTYRSIRRASVIADRIIKNGSLTIDVSKVENELRKGELYSLADTITRYLSEQSGKEVEGEVKILSYQTIETADEKKQTVIFQWGRKKFNATKNLSRKTSEYIISEYSKSEKETKIN